MRDDPVAAYPANLASVDIGDEANVAFWTAKWDITRAELTDAVRHAGVDPEAVAEELRLTVA